jgi:hypothetical protein
MQPMAAKAPPQHGDLAQTQSQETIFGPSVAIADRGAVRADHLACAPLAHLIYLVKISCGLASGGMGHHFLAATSRKIALSSIA